MRFSSLQIEGAGVVSVERLLDPRGFFARTFCTVEFEEFGLPTAFVQSSTSFNHKKGTIRGMHFQWPPSCESKLVRCVQGHLYDVLLDLRPQSVTYLRHEAVILDSENRDAVYVPAGVAHGFQTLKDDTEVLYQMTDFYASKLSAGIRWDDPEFDIRWPLSEVVLSERDRGFPNFSRALFEEELSRREISGRNQARVDA